MSISGCSAVSKRWESTRTADGKPVKNQGLWLQLDALSQLHRIEWKWVRGHSGHPENERADALANQGVLQAQQH